MAQFPNPEDSHTPVAPLRVLMEKNLDPLKIKSCAVPDKDRVAGCQCSDRCRKWLGAQAGLTRVPKNGVAGTGGEGPFNVAWYRRDSVSRTERMDYMPCFALVTTMFDSYEQQHKTGDKIEVLGEEGTRIVQQFMKPVDPNSNKTGDTRMKTETRELVVPPFPSLETQTPALEYALKMAEIRKRQAAQAAFEGEFADDNIADAEAQPLEAASPGEPVASAAPVKRGRGRPRGTTAV